MYSISDRYSSVPAFNEFTHKKDKANNKFKNVFTTRKLLQLLHKYNCKQFGHSNPHCENLIL